MFTFNLSLSRLTASLLTVALLAMPHVTHASPVAVGASAVDDLGWTPGSRVVVLGHGLPTLAEMGLTVDDVFNTTLHRQRGIGMASSEDGVIDDGAPHRLARRYQPECLSRNRAPKVGVDGCLFLLGNFKSDLVLTANPIDAWCRTVDLNGHRTDVFGISGVQGSASSFVVDVKTGIQNIVDNCNCPAGTSVNDCTIGGTDVAAGNGALGIWVLGSVLTA